MANGSMEEIVVAQADAAAGRVVGAGRYWGGYALLIGIYFGSALTQKFDSPLWVDFLFVFVMLTTYQALFRKFKKRSIN